MNLKVAFFRAFNDLIRNADVKQNANWKVQKKGNNNRGTVKIKTGSMALYKLQRSKNYKLQTILVTKVFFATLETAEIHASAVSQAKERGYGKSRFKEWRDAAKRERERERKRGEEKASITKGVKSYAKYCGLLFVVALTCKWPLIDGPAYWLSAV